MRFDEKTKVALIQALKEMDQREEEETRQRKSEGVPLADLRAANLAARGKRLETKSRADVYMDRMLNPVEHAKEEMLRGLQIYEQAGLDMGAFVRGVWSYE